MRKFSYTLLAATFFQFFLIGLVTADEGAEGRDYFLKVNIWYERPNKIESTNYHKGAMLKVGKKFKIISVKGRKITFSDGANEYSLIRHKKHTKVDIQAMFERYFSKKSVTAKGGAFTKFSKKERKNIKLGQLSKGMSKDAVIMAYGYPPEHRTASLESDLWVYWANRWVSKNAIFENGKLLSYK